MPSSVTAMERHVPSWKQFKPLLTLAPRAGTRLERRIGGATNIAELREIGRRRTPRPVFDYVDGAAGDEVSMRRSREAFDRVEFLPRVLRDVSSVDTTTMILGQPSSMPFAFAPTGYTRMMHAEGEAAVARVAARAGIPYSLSTVGTTTPEDVALASGDGRRWFQLYVWNDREASRQLIERAKNSGFDVLILTVDVPVGGARLRDVRNGLTIPPTLNLSTFVSGALHPRWLFDFLTTPPPTFATLDGGGTIPMQYVAGKMFDSSVTFADLAWFREIWPGPIVIKGVQSVDDALLIAEQGIDGIVLSNHGGRQLDRAATPLELLPDVIAKVGDRLDVFLDTGVRSGSDIVAAMAMGAKAVLVGRAYLYGLMAGGELGVQRCYDLLVDDLKRTMQLLGATSIADLDSAMVRLRP
jgi:L-lactate dehydrogenase (cytochrome)